MKNKVITNREMFDSFRKKCGDIDKHITDYRPYSEEFKNEDYDYYQIVIWLDNEEKIYYLKRKYTIPILDDIEKNYLEGVLRPFKDIHVRVVKRASLECNTFINHYKSCEYISFLINGNRHDLPSFKKGTMYKGMELDNKYTLEELGLFEGE